MNHVMEYIYYNLKSRLSTERFVKNANRGGDFRFANKVFLNLGDFNHLLYEKLSSSSSQGFMVARFGTVEFNCLKAFDFGLTESVLRGNLFVMERQAGFYPQDLRLGEKFAENMKGYMQDVDILGTQFLRHEEYYIRRYMPNSTKCVLFRNLDPFMFPERPWTEALQGRKVLVIHPFADSIMSQYQRRKNLFPDINILPDFDLKCLKAVQTLRGCEKTHATWFDALDDMYEKALGIDAEVVIIGCGAYGFPLASKLKRAGRITIHIGGMVQSLFGIKCKRFDEASDYEYLRRYYNDYWTYASKNETPCSSKDVEGGAYWK